MGKRVFVLTGATGLTGRAAAQAFSERGDSLVLIGTDRSRLDALGRELNLPAERLLPLVVDLRDGPAVASALGEADAKFGRVDGLIHLVGGWVGGRTLADTPPSDLEAMLGQHAWTTFHLFQALGPRLAANGWGRVIIVSASNVSDPTGKTGAYTAAKAAQENLVLTLAAELRGAHVTANIIQVRSIGGVGEGGGTSPDEIVASILYLCSEQAGKVSGARIPLFR